MLVHVPVPLLGCCAYRVHPLWGKPLNRAVLELYTIGAGLGGGHTKMFPFLPGANVGGFGLLKNGGESTLEIMDQAGAVPAIYLNGAETTLGPPLLRNRVPVWFGTDQTWH